MVFKGNEDNATIHVGGVPYFEKKPTIHVWEATQKQGSVLAPAKEKAVLCVHRDFRLGPTNDGVAPIKRSLRHLAGCI